MIQAITNVAWDHILENPCAVDVVSAIQKIAKKNAEIYEQVFPHLPRDDTKKFSMDHLVYHLPYPLAFDRVGTKMKNSFRDLPYPLHMNPAEKAELSARAKESYIKYVMAAGKEENYREVIPASLSSKFMTTRLLPHQTAALADPSFGRSHQLYETNTVHDVKTTIDYLRKQVVGFFLAAPLDWGMETKIDGSIGKHKSIDVSQSGTAHDVTGNG